MSEQAGVFSFLFDWFIVQENLNTVHHLAPVDERLDLCDELPGVNVPANMDPDLLQLWLELWFRHVEACLVVVWWGRAQAQRQSHLCPSSPQRSYVELTPCNTGFLHVGVSRFPHTLRGHLGIRWACLDNGVLNGTSLRR